MTNFDDIDNESLAERLKHEITLFRSVEDVWKDTSADKKTYPRGYERFKTRILMKNVKKGIRIIERKNPLYLEMPSMKEIGNGQVKRIYDDKYKDKPVDDHVDCYDAISNSPAKTGLIEDKKED